MRRTPLVVALAALIATALRVAPSRAATDPDAKTAEQWLKGVPLSLSGSMNVTIEDFGAARVALGLPRVASSADVNSGKLEVDDLVASTRISLGAVPLLADGFQNFRDASSLFGFDPSAVTVAVSVGDEPTLGFLAGGINTKAVLAKAGAGKAAKKLSSSGGTGYDLSEFDLVSDFKRSSIGTTFVGAPNSGAVLAVVGPGGDADDAQLALAVAAGKKTKPSVADGPVAAVLAGVGPFHAFAAGPRLVGGPDVGLVVSGNADDARRRASAATAATPPTPLVCGIGTTIQKDGSLFSRTACMYPSAAAAKTAQRSVESTLKNDASAAAKVRYSSLVTVRASAVKGAMVTFDLAFAKNVVPRDLIFRRDFPPFWG